MYELNIQNIETFININNICIDQFLNLTFNTKFCVYFCFKLNALNSVKNYDFINMICQQK